MGLWVKEVDSEVGRGEEGRLGEGRGVILILRMR